MIIYYIYHLPNFVWKDGMIGKIGVSEKPIGRVKEQGQTEYEILEEHTCIYKVSDREIELQKEYGYPVDCLPYWKTRKMHSLEGCSKGGITQGNINKESGHMSSLGKKYGAIAKETGHLDKIRTEESCSKGGKKGGKTNADSGHMQNIQPLGSSKGGKVGGPTACNINYTCPHCGKEGKGPSIFRSHFDRCKHKH